MTFPGLAAVRRQVDLPPAVAAWVLAAHAFSLAAPFVLLAVVWRHAGVLSHHVDHAALLALAAGLLLMGSAFEVAQNTQDRWYYTAPYPAFCDLLFTVLIASGLVVLAVAVDGDAPWVIPLGIVALLLTIGLYATGRPGFAGMAVAGTVATAGLYQVTHQPATVLVLVFTGAVNAIMLEAVVRYRVQSCHGGIAFANGAGLVIVAWVLELSALGRRAGWVPVLVAGAVIVAVAGLSWPLVARHSPTRRPFADRDQPLTPAATPTQLVQGGLSAARSYGS